MMRKIIDQDYLRSILDYDRANGVFTWKIIAGNRIRVGTIAGCIDGGSGYVVIRIGSTSYLAHRLAFIWMLGQAPDIIDHRNGIKIDNSWLNLREANHVLNAQNTSARRNNILGIKGISTTSVGTYHARVTPLIGKRISKTFKDLDDAINFVIETRRLEHGDFANS